MRRFVQSGGWIAVDRRRVLRASVGAAGVLIGARAVRAAGDHDVSDWVASEHVRVRLIDAGPTATGRLAGLQMQLDPSFLTYWRTPGEAGVPPTASFEGSANLRSAALAFPAPQRFDEGGSEAFGYKTEVIFLVRVEPVDLRLPVSLAVALSFAVCSDLCLPGQVKLRLDLDGSGRSPEADLVRDASRLVPVPMPLGGPGPLAVVAVEPGAAPDQARVRVRNLPDTTPELFVEAPDPWFIQVGPGSAAGADTVFDIRALSGPKARAKVPLTLTLVAGERAVETVAELDLAAPLP